MANERKFNAAVERAIALAGRGALSDQGKIDCVANAIAASRRGTPNADEQSFAHKFVIAWQTMKAIDAAELGARGTDQGQ